MPLVRDYLIHGEESVAQDRHEHEELEQSRDLESLDGANPRFMEVVLDLQATLAHHIAVEEGQQFPQVRLAAPAGELAALRERVQAVERIATPGPHAAATTACCWWTRVRAWWTGSATPWPDLRPHDPCCGSGGDRVGHQRGSPRGRRRPLFPTVRPTPRPGG